MTKETIEIEDWYDHGTRMRYGSVVPQHQGISRILERNLSIYEERMKAFSAHTDVFQQLPFEQTDATTPFWDNGFFPFLDVVALYGFMMRNKPARYIEIGSGNSTKVAAHAKKLGQLKTELISIDPCPRAEIDSLCDQVIREPLQNVDLSLFDTLGENDILFFDGSHRVLQNSDNQILFFDIIPALKPGVLIHIHDINWPCDYPEEWRNRYYNEQYVLGAMLLYASDRLEVEFPGAYVSMTCDPSAHFGDTWHRLKDLGVPMHGCSFWFKHKQV